MQSPSEPNPCEQMAEESAGLRIDKVAVYIALAVGLLSVLALHADTLRQTVSVWRHSETYGIGWIVLPTLAYLLWHNREHVAGQQPVGSVPGVWLTVFFSAAWLAADLANISEGRQLALLAIACAIVLAAVGWQAFVVLLPYLALLVFLVPTGGFLLTPLKLVTVGFIGALGAVPGLQVETAGFVAFVDSQRYVVIDDCAGLPYLLLDLFLGLTLALLIFRTWWKIALLTLLGGLLAILANGLRVITIVAYDYLTGSELDLTGHAYFGWIANGLALLVLLSVFSRLDPERAAASGLRGRPAMPGQPTRALGLLLLALVPVAAVPVLAPSIASGPVPHVQAQLPAGLVGWQRRDRSSDWHPGSGSDATLDSVADYAKHGKQVSVYMAQAGSPQAKVSGGGIDLIGSERWMRSRHEQRAVCVDGQCLEFFHLRLVLRDTQQVRHVYTLFAVGTRTMVSPLMLRMHRAWARLRAEPLSARLIAIASDGEAGLDDREVGLLLGGLVAQGHSGRREST